MLFVSSFSFSQQSKDTLNLDEKFDKIYRTSSSYQEYKVVSKVRFQNLKKEVLDSLNSLKEIIRSKNTLIKKQSDSVSVLEKINKEYLTDLNQTIAEKNSMNFLGMQIQKSVYNIVVWLLVVVFAFLTGYFLFLFKNSNIITKQSKQELLNVEEEFAQHKKKSLEREQKLRRKLQDEINKSRGV